MSKLFTALAILSLLFLSTGRLVFAQDLPAPTAPTSVAATVAFDVSFSFSLEPNTTYHIKARIGKTESSLTKGQTYKSSDDSWLSSGSAWTLFPTVTTDGSGFWSGVIKAKTSSTVELGENLLGITLRKLNTTTNIESLTTTLNITSAPKPPPNPPPTSKVDVSLSEFMPNPKDGDEWVEIYNPTTTQANLGGWKVDDGPAGSAPASLGKDFIIEPKAFAVFYFSSRLNNSGDSLRLLRTDNSEEEVIEFGKTSEGVAFAKDSKGVWQQTSTPTPGTPNKISSGEVLSEQNKKEEESESLETSLFKELIATASSGSQKPISTQQPGIPKVASSVFLPVILVGLGIILVLFALLTYLIKAGIIKKPSFRKGKAPEGNPPNA